jgi:hypothetical protein
MFRARLAAVGCLMVLFLHAPAARAQVSPVQGTTRDKEQTAAKSNSSPTVRAIATDLMEEHRELERLRLQRNQLSALKSSLHSVESILARVPDQSAAAAALTIRFGQIKVRADEAARQISVPQRIIIEVPPPPVPPSEGGSARGPVPTPAGTVPPPASAPATPLVDLRSDAASFGDQLEWILNNTQYAAQPVESQLALVGQLIEAARYNAGTQATPLVLPAPVSGGQLYGPQAFYGPPPRYSFSQQSVPQAPGGAGVSFAVRQAFPQTSAVLDRLQRAQLAAELPAAELWQAANAELAGLPKTLDATTSQSKLKASYDLMKSRLDGYTRDVDAEIKERDQKRLELDNQLRDTDTFIGQSQINFYLVFAVYGMIAVIGGVFFVLATKKENDIIRVLIRERILIEVLSMGFLLLTVIILGTGKIVDKEGLAALLGTIAGYIFGQKTGQLMARAGRRPGAPVTRFAAAPASGPAPLDVRLTDETTNDPTEWSWTFGDGGTSSERHPTHRYLASGVYTVTLRASNDGGSSTHAFTITVTSPPEAEPATPAAPPHVPVSPPVAPPAPAASAPDAGPAVPPSDAGPTPPANGQPPEPGAARGRGRNGPRARPRPDRAK